MTVGNSTVTTIRPGRGAEAVAESKKFAEIVTRHGGRNVRSMLLMSSSPLRLVLSYEAEDQGALGEISEKLLADAEIQKMMVETFGEGGTSSGYVSETWIEV